MTGEGWTFIMYKMQDHASPTLVVLYFGFVTLFVVFFVINLFVAVLSDSYLLIIRQEDDKELAKQEL